MFPWVEGPIRIVFEHLITLLARHACLSTSETFSINDAHLLYPEGKEWPIMYFVFITFYFGIEVHVGIKVVMELLFRDVGGGPKEE